MGSEPDSTPAPWAVGLDQLRGADTFWLSTIRPDGPPHATSLIAAWHAEALWFTTGPAERKARNLAENPSCVLRARCSDLFEGALDVVREGQAERVTDDAQFQPVATAFAVKYPTGPWDFVVRDGAFSDRDAGGRVILFRVRWCAAWGSPRAIGSARRPGGGHGVTPMR
jgi:Pyridoxamine 5'-phosphate oxidase